MSNTLSETLQSIHETASSLYDRYQYHYITRYGQKGYKTSQKKKQRMEREKLQKNKLANMMIKSC